MPQSYKSLEQEHKRVIKSYTELLRSFAHHHIAHDDANSDCCRECGLDLRNAIHRADNVDARKRWGPPTLIV